MVVVFPPSEYLPASWVASLPVSTAYSSAFPTYSLLYPGQDWVFQNAWISAILISGLIYIILMAGWVIPKYQPELKGSLLTGYIADDTATTFGVIRSGSATNKDEVKPASPSGENS